VQHSQTSSTSCPSRVVCARTMRAASSPAPLVRYADALASSSRHRLAALPVWITRNSIDCSTPQTMWFPQTASNRNAVRLNAPAPTSLFCTNTPRDSPCGEVADGMRVFGSTRNAKRSCALAYRPAGAIMSPTRTPRLACEPSAGCRPRRRPRASLTGARGPRGRNLPAALGEPHQPAARDVGVPDPRVTLRGLAAQQQPTVPVEEELPPAAAILGSEPRVRVVEAGAAVSAGRVRRYSAERRRCEPSARKRSWSSAPCCRSRRSSAPRRCRRRR